MDPIYRSHEIREIEARAVIAPGTPPLMQRAGVVAAHFARDKLLRGRRRILALAGPGNNGGDGLVMATQFRKWRLDVNVLFMGDERKLSTDALGALMGWRAAGGVVFSDPPRGDDWDLVVDALFGIGLERELTSPYVELVTYINRQRCARLALDLPSGLHADSGRVLGSCVQASHTLTFIGLKPGLLTSDGPGMAGEIRVEPLDLDPAALLPPRGFAADDQVLVDLLPRRQINAHKGTHGSLGIIGGAPGMAGAALLAGRTAQHAGAGRVYVGFLGHAPAFDPNCLELMLRPALDVGALPHLTAFAFGPGLGTSDAAAEVLTQLLSSEQPVLLDADALNLLALDDTLREQCAARTAPTLLTPHPAEAARLLGGSIEDVQRERIPVTLALAKAFNAHVVLKGAGSICATPDGRWFINRTGNPGLASAGMGDVLSGLAGALLAQGVAPLPALLGAVYLHGKAADSLVAQGVGPVGLSAHELIDAIRAILNALPRRE
ncbi:MAG: NAD(P)H-hydrate dehydratase [Betaproteobacteria bacterium]|nr:NAD(P)H-hydrate dehydratase [Betaproteobacteria bacterium]